MKNKNNSQVFGSVIILIALAILMIYSKANKDHNSSFYTVPLYTYNGVMYFIDDFKTGRF